MDDHTKALQELGEKVFNAVKTSVRLNKAGELFSASIVGKHDGVKLSYSFHAERSPTTSERSYQI